MFFVLSKTLNYLVMPLTIIWGCLLLSLLIKHKVWKKRLLLGGIILLLIFSNDFIANEFMRAWEIETKAYSSMRKFYWISEPWMRLNTVKLPTPSTSIFLGPGLNRHSPG